MSLGECCEPELPGGFYTGRLPEIGSVVDQPIAIETTFKLIEEHTAVEESVLRYCIDRSRVVSNDEAYGIIQGLIDDERSHHEMLDKLMSDLKDLYGEQLALG